MRSLSAKARIACGCNLTLSLKLVMFSSRLHALVPGFLLTLRKLSARIIQPLAVTFFLLLAPLDVFAQTPGQIFESAAGTKPSGQLVLDPNGDGFVSQTSSGFTMLANDVPQFEIPYRSLPVLQDEPVGDVRTGASGGHTELIDGYADNGVFMYADDFGLYFRMRLAGTSTASKGYTFLINTEDKFDEFGKTVVNGNPGFQFEVTLQTGGGNAGINIYDWRDNSGNRLGTPLPLSSHHQRAISGSILNAVDADDYGYFYDWYVPFSVLTGHDLMTPGTLFRAAAATVTSSNSGISGTVSDVNGVNDLEYGSPLAAFIAAVESFPPTSAESLEENDFPPTVVKTKTPIVLGPLLDGDDEISGTISEPSGTSIEVFKDGVSIGTTTSTTSFTWILSSIAPTLESGQEITARATNTADSKTVSDVSNSVFVGAPGEPVLACLQTLGAAVISTVNMHGSGRINDFTVTVSGLRTAVTAGGYANDLKLRIYEAGTFTRAKTKTQNNADEIDVADITLTSTNVDTSNQFTTIAA